MRKLDNTHIPFLKNLFLMLTGSNSRNILSKIITNNLEKLLIKIYCFQWDFSLQIFSHSLWILNQTLSCDFYVISHHAFIVVFMNFEFSLFFCFLFKFRRTIYFKAVNLLFSPESFITDETLVSLFNTR